MALLICIFRVRSVCAAGQPARSQVSRYIRLSGSDRDFPALTGTGTRRLRSLLRAPPIQSSEFVPPASGDSIAGR